MIDRCQLTFVSSFSYISNFFQAHLNRSDGASASVPHAEGYHSVVDVCSFRQLYNSSDEYSRSENSSGSDMKLSDDFGDSDENSDHSIQEEVNNESAINLNYNQEICVIENNQHPNNISYPKKILLRTLLILSLKIKKNLDNDTIQYITELVDSVAEKPQHFTSLYHFKNIIHSFSFPFETHHLCPTCGVYIGLEVINTNESTLKCEPCNVDVVLKDNRQLGNIFLYCPLSEQLQEFCTRHHENLTYPMNRKKQCDYAIEDIMDGKLYNLSSSDEDSLSLNFSVDGTPLFKSSQTSITPVLCTINELHPRERKQHIMLACIFLGHKKPNMNQYLKPFVEESKKLATEGVCYSIEGREHKKKIKILVGVCDSVERPNLRSSKTFRGEYGCGLCKHKGEEVEKGASHVRVFPIDKNGNAFGQGLRLNSETETHAKNRTMGMKDRSVLFDVPNFDIINNLAVDWMHCVALGICRQFLKLWLDSQYHEKPYYLGAVINDIDHFLTSIKPSLDISRTPRKLSERLHLKAHELVIWLLFYSLPTLKEYLPRRYLLHWSLLVEAISILLKTSILKTEVYYAKQCIFKFVKDIEVLYGLEHVSFNAHLLTHLPESVLNWGPLWTHSAFCYENFHQVLKKLVKSSNSAELQILESLRCIITLNKLEECYEHELILRQRKFLKNMINKRKYTNNMMKINEIKVIGKGVTEIVADDHNLAFRRLNIHIDNDPEVRYFKRIIINNEVIHSQAYTKVRKRNNFTVLLSNKKIFEIDIFIIVELQGKKECFALGKYFQKCKNTFFPDVQLQHIIFTKSENTHQPLGAINAKTIQRKVTIINDFTNQLRIACIHPNKFELLT